MSKRSHGEGTLYQRKDGRWQASLQVGGVRRTVYGKIEREVRNRLRDLQRTADHEGSLPDPGQRTVNDLLNAWLDSAPNLKPSTIANYRWFLDGCVRPALGDVRLERVKPDRLQRLYADLTPSVGEKVHRLLHRAFAVAVLWRWLVTNPCDHVLKPAYKAQQKTLWNHQSGSSPDALLKRVSERRVVVVVGASGSGKSSLVGAGLNPRLADNALPGSKDWLLPYRTGPQDRREWAGLRFTPGEVSDNPFTALAVRLAPLLPGVSPRDLADQLAANPETLCTLCEQALHGQPDWAELLLFVDQFEELFTTVKSEYRIPFVELLACAANTNRLRTVLTLRADFYHRCVEYPRLAELLREGSFPLAAPELDALLHMIERPAVLAGLKFDQGLPGRILRDTGQEPGALALMAYALDELFSLANMRGDHCLTFEDYEKLGGVEKAIGTRAENVFAGLDEKAQAALPHVFRELVAVNIEGTPTRKRALLSTAAASDPARRLVEKLTAARLLVQSRSEDHHRPVIEVAHEALFRSWPTLEAWIGRTKGDLYLLQQVQEAAALWTRYNRDNAFLWPDERLKPVYAMQERLQPNLDAVTQEFIRQEAERLLKELEDINTPHKRRSVIGERLDTIGDPRPGVGLRSDGLPDIVWCYVPGGRITLEDKAKSSFTVEPFYIARYPVTMMQFQVFVDAPDGFHNPQWWEGLAAEDNHKQAPGEQRFKFSNHPRERVSWYDAVAFCRWLNAKLPPDGWPEEARNPGPQITPPPAPTPQAGRGSRFNRLLGRPLLPEGEGPTEGRGMRARWEIRLPAEWEWQQAATGGNPANTYPWGPEWDGRRANTTESGLSRTTAVGMYPHGAAVVQQPEGVAHILDMSGNVWEWCLNEHGKPENTGLGGNAVRVLRGGSWNYDRSYARAASRYGRDLPDSRYSSGGFRVVAARPML